MTETIYVILVNYNGWADTIECLESLLRCETKGVRLIVVDNGSTDGSIEKLVEWASGRVPPTKPKSAALQDLAWPPVSKPVDHIAISRKEPEAARLGDDAATLTFVATHENLGFAGGNNVALRLLLDANATGFVCLVNNDMVVAPSALRSLREAIVADSTLGAVGGLILDYNQPDLVQAAGGGHMSRLTGMSHVSGAGVLRRDARRPQSLGFISGGLLLTRIETLRDVGLMDESYFLYAEDADWGERMRAKGYRLGCALDAIVWHKGSQTTGARTPFQDYYVVRSSLMFVRKHARLNAGLAALYSVFRMLAPKILRAEWPRARSVLRAYVSYARGT